MKKGKKLYYCGLDIGTDSVGYAATTPTYELQKFRGEPVWGVTTFEAASLAEERRIARTARRRLDRRQQRVQLIGEIFAPSVCAIDPDFFIRRKESGLYADDSTAGVHIFEGGMTDREYHKKYPTIHHLLFDLMNSSEPHDVRLVYLACSWLVANRGHFLFETASGELNDFQTAYTKLRDYLREELEASLPWDDSVQTEIVQQIMQTETGIKRKQELFTAQVFGGKKPSKQKNDDFPLNRDAITALLSGGKAAPKDLFFNDEYAALDAVSLGMDEENFARILAELGDDGELLRRLREMYDCAVLNRTLHGKKCISEAKIGVYEQHRKDLKFLKSFLKKYKKDKYNTVFRADGLENYVGYSYNVKSCKAPENVKKKVNKDNFSDFVYKIVKDIKVSDADAEQYADMLNRLKLRTFLPKQKDTDNRVIPQQLYRTELAAVLANAEHYLPMLSQRDDTGYTGSEKILSVFDFRIPYFVGPLNSASPKAWIVRDPGKLYPWNFAELVDLDASEEGFIRKMTNTCTYLPGEDVLPVNSLLYSRFMVLKELNNLKINGNSIPVPVKQELYTALFEQKNGRITLTTIRDYLASRGHLHPGDEISGIDITFKSSLKSYHSFRRLLVSGTLSEHQVEDIIRRAAFSEDKSRMEKWLSAHYPQLTKDDRRYILQLKLKEFGRLSAMFLTGIYHEDPATGEAFSIMDLLWQTNCNLMQLLSGQFGFREKVEAFAAEYYTGHPQKLADRLDDLYISNAVKRPIIRTLDIVAEVVKAMGGAPEKIFVEMARGGTPEQRGRRTQSRKQQILELYKSIKTEESRRLMAELEAMGESAENRLQGDKLFLYYMQLGKCMYTGEAIDLAQLASKTYDIDHIYPQSKVQDDSILNNKVLVLSSANGAKSDRYPVDAEIRTKMRDSWDLLLSNGLITKEKHSRLTRSTGFTEEELHRFINRQLVETRQSTKAVAQLLKERYPDTQIVYVKAGMVSEFRQEYDLLKSRAVNDLHHAKDAYLNIVVGNVYHEKFTSRWFDVRQEYSVNTRTIFGRPLKVGGELLWQGQDDIAKVKKVMGKNAVHLTRYAFCRKGGLFDQMPVKAGMDLIPRKIGLSTEKYGGYNKPTASYYLLVSYNIGSKKDVIFAPVELLYADRVKNDPEFALRYITETVSAINSNKPLSDVRIQLGGRPIKINTVIEMDGMRVTLSGKTNRGSNIIVSADKALVLGYSLEKYVKQLERFAEKRQNNPGLVYNAQYDKITAADNMELYEVLSSKLTESVFRNCPGNIGETVRNGREKFADLGVEEQVKTLLSIISWFGSAQNCDLVSIGGKAKSGTKVPNAKLSAWAKNYSDVRIIDTSASGLYETRSENLLELL